MFRIATMAEYFNKLLLDFNKDIMTINRLKTEQLKSRFLEKLKNHNLI